MALSTKEQEELLRSEQICFVASTCEDGAPHTVPVWFIWQDGHFYWHTDLNTTKTRNLRRDNRIMVCVGGKETIAIKGHAIEVTEDELGFDIMKLYWEKYPNHMFEKYTKNRVIFRVDADQTLSWHYESNS